MANRTPGPWTLRGVQIRANGGRGQHVATYQISQADGQLIAAAPDLLEMVLDAIGCAEACGGSEAQAESYKQRLAKLGLVALVRDEHNPDTSFESSK